MNLKRLHISTSQGKKRKYNMHGLKSENKKTVNEIFVKINKKDHPRALLIVIRNISSVFNL